MSLEGGYGEGAWGGPFVPDSVVMSDTLLFTGVKRKNKKSCGKKLNPKRRWTSEEDEVIKRHALTCHPNKPNFSTLAQTFPDRSEMQITTRWRKVLDPDLKKGCWTPEEDAEVLKQVNIHGPKSWTKVAKHLPGRIGKQCRERYHNHLSQDINKGPWTTEEDEIIIKMHGEIGNKWSKISENLQGRTDNAIKNRWNSTLKRRAGGQGASSCSGEVKKGRPRKRPLPQELPEFPPLHSSPPKQIKTEDLDESGYGSFTSNFITSTPNTYDPTPSYFITPTKTTPPSATTSPASILGLNTTLNTSLHTPSFSPISKDYDMLKDFTDSYLTAETTVGTPSKSLIKFESTTFLDDLESPGGFNFDFEDKENLLVTPKGRGQGGSSGGRGQGSGRKKSSKKIDFEFDKVFLDMDTFPELADII